MKEIHIDAPPEVVFAYFTDPEKMTRWLCTEAKSDPRPGGTVEQTHPADDGDPDGPYHMRGEFIEVDHPNRLVFSWGFTNSVVGVKPGTTKVEVDFVAADGGTDLRLVHSGTTTALPSSYDRGWEELLGILAGLEL